MKQRTVRSIAHPDSDRATSEVDPSTLSVLLAHPALRTTGLADVPIAELHDELATLKFEALRKPGTRGMVTASGLITQSDAIAPGPTTRERHRAHTSVVVDRSALMPRSLDGMQALQRVPESSVMQMLAHPPLATAARPASRLPATVLAIAAVALAMVALPMLVGCGDNIIPAELVDASIRNNQETADDPNADPTAGNVFRTSDIATNVGLEHPVIVYAVAADGSQTDISKRMTWDVRDPSIATIDDTDTLHAVHRGQTSVVASMGARSIEFQVTVGDAVITSLTLEPPSLAIPLGLSGTLTAIGHYSDGHTADVTSAATWVADEDDRATVAAGHVTGMAWGTTHVHAAVGAQDADADVEVTGCHLVINEVKTGTLLLTRDEFIELYNPCETAIDLAHTRLVYRVVLGLLDISLGDLTGSIGPGDYKVYGGTSYLGISDGSLTTDLASIGGSIALRNTTSGADIDSLGWGTGLGDLVEGVGALVVPAGHSLERTPNGHDSDNNSLDFADEDHPTPGASND